jgi:transcriptional regulator of acetoin/glycerol metabolism
VQKSVEQEQFSILKNKYKDLIEIFEKKAVELIDKYCSEQYLFILTNSAGIVLSIQDDGQSKQRGIKEGDYLSEVSCGTNAISVAKEAKRRIYLEGEEHYCQILRKLGCIAEPIRINNQIIGYLDISITRGQIIKKQELLFDLLFNYVVCQLRRQATYVESDLEKELDELKSEILELSANGCKIKEISNKLHLSESNVKYQRKKIREILEAENMSHAVAKAIKYKQLSFDKIKP